MEELKLHSLGENDYLKALKEKYTTLIKKLKSNNDLSEEEKQTEQKRLERLFKKENKEAKKNMY